MASTRSRLVRWSLVRAVRAMRTGQVRPDTPPGEIDVVALRDQLERLASRAPVPPGVRVEPERSAPVPAEWVRHRNAVPGRVLLWLHGGAHCLGSPRTHRLLAASLARVTAAAVLLPDFRLAPEHPYPAALEDATATYRWLLERGTDPAHLAVGGDSSGGGLCVSMLVRLRDEGTPLPACAVLLSPWVDLTLSGASWQPGVVDDPWLPAELAHLPVRAYCGDRDPADPGISPLFADLHGLPPTLIHVGTDELLVDDARALAARMREAGVDATLGVWPGMWHVFQAFPGVPEARRALREIGGFVRRHTGHPTGVDEDQRRRGSGVGAAGSGDASAVG